MDKKRKIKKKMELSTPKKKSHPSNSHFICDKQAVVQLERLSDSVVAGMTACGSALPPEQVNESSDDALDINSFPDEIILEVFSYLEQNQLGQIARVCRRWNVLTKSPALWKKVNVKLSPSHECQTTVAESFINGLPFCATSIRLDFTDYYMWIGTLDFSELCLKLQEKCPHAEEFILSNTKLSHSLPAVIDLCMQFLQNVKELVFNQCIFTDYSERVEFCGTSKIEVLDLSGCALGGFSRPHFSRMPCLKVLGLHNTNVYVSWFLDDIPLLGQLHVLDLGLTGVDSIIFQAIQYHGLNLKEFYVCRGYLQNHDLTFNNSVFPHLKTICLSGNYVTCKGVVSLIQSCPSLENVYVNRYVAISFYEHPFVVANRCKSGTVKAIVRHHSHNVDYLHSQF